MTAVGQRLTNLPAPRTRLIGRESDVAAVCERVLHADGRLVTLAGAGGSGKTALALEVARSLLAEFPDGVWLAELAPLADQTLVPHATAAVFGVREGAGSVVLDALVAYLEPRSLLLVLDNAEHLIEAVAALCEQLLSACPRLRLLVTSREPLRIPGELSWRVPTLAVPDPERPGRPDELADFSAVRLFAERAGAAQPAFALTPQNAAAVARICARLDGMPLALELAGARARTLTAEQILARLDDSFRLLSDGSRTAHSRQQTMRATLDWSHTLLADDERILFRRLAVFAGGWDLEAAEAVCAGDAVAPEAVLDLLDRLAEKSLVLVDASGAQARYRFLEPIRQYAYSHLEAAEETAATRANHARDYLELVEQIAATVWDGRLLGPFSAQARLAYFVRLELEHDNLRAALAWTEEWGEAEALARLVVALHAFWFLHGYMAEGARWEEVALGRGADLPPPLRAGLLGAAGELLAWGRGDHARGLELHTEALALFRSLGDARNVGHMLISVGVQLGFRGDLEAAHRLMRECLSVYRELDDPWGTAWTLVDLGQILRHQGEHAEALALTEEALPHVRRSGDTWLLIQILTALGGLVLEAGDPQRATSLAAEALELLRDSGLRWCLPEALELAAAVAGARGHAAVAARLFGASESTREVTGASRFIGESTYAGFVQAGRADLDEQAFRAAWAAGRLLASQSAIEEAVLTVQSESAAPVAPPKPASIGPLGLLTPREREVAALVARGLTNKQVADELVIVEGTAAIHVSSILGKLGFTSRAQIAAWATANGLVQDT